MNRLPIRAGRTGDWIQCPGISQAEGTGWLSSPQHHAAWDEIANRMGQVTTFTLRQTWHVEQDDIILAAFGHPTNSPHVPVRS